TDRYRRPGLDLRQRWTAAAGCRTAEPHQLGRPAADVEQDDAFGVGIEQRRAASGGELGLGLAVDDFEIEPDVLRDAGAEFATIDRGAAGLGGDQPRAGDPAVRHLVAADRERLDRARNRGVADAAGGGDALAQADDAGERVDDPKRIAGRTRDQE